MIFGTDGIRSEMGSGPLTQGVIEALSKVIRDWLPGGARVVLGSDTRTSRDTLKQWITTHFGGLEILDLGIVPTPVVAFETAFREAHLGIMLTASHNPAKDNGLKFFDHEGLKIAYSQAVAWSEAVEALLENGGAGHAGAPAARIDQDPDGYRRFIAGRFLGTDFSGLRAGFDLANGAACQLAPELIAALGIDAVFLGDQPNGTNINDHVGALHPEQLAALVRENNLNAGFALDGDGDRLIVTTGEPLHGDVVLYALTTLLRESGEKFDTVVGTIMCGAGFEQALEQDGIRLIRTPVGDQNVLAKMVEHDLPLGGEPSGHLILGNLFRAGDGLLAALILLRALKETPTLLEDARRKVPLYPVIETALPVVRKPPLEEIEPVWSQIQHLEKALDGSGRLIVRYSGTEPKLRLFLEAPDIEPYSDDVNRLCDAINKELG